MVELHTNLGSNVHQDAGSYQDIKIRKKKARGMFTAQRYLWKPKEITSSAKMRIFNSKVI